MTPAEREAVIQECARVCEERAFRHDDNASDKADKPHDRDVAGRRASEARACAKAIRALAQTPSPDEEARALLEEAARRLNSWPFGQYHSDSANDAHYLGDRIGIYLARHPAAKGEGGV